ncbi:AfsR/SARP family transcriptional regulator [Blastococcus sp. SYSU D00820]
MSGDLWIGVLGPTEVRRGGRVQELRGPAPRRLLAVLVAARGAPVPDDRLAGALWPDGVPGGAAATLQSHVSRLRTALGDAGRTLLRRAGDGYALALPPGTVDADVAASRIAAAAAAAGPRAALAELDAALALWRGTPYADVGEDDLAAERARLAELRETAVEARLAARLALGDAAGAVPELVARTEVAPFRERGWELLVLALYRTGRQADALATLRRVRALLDRELGIPPGEELQRLEAAVLAQDPRLLLDVPRPAPSPHPAPSARPRRPATRFVGRDADLARLRAALAAAPLVTVTGPGGVGKTRLVVELLADRGDPGAADLVRLAEVSGPGFVGLQVAQALGVAGPDDVVAALARRPGLLVLDNCEHLLDEVADLVAAVLDGAPGTTVLATSREPLGVDGEVVLPLAPLAEDAVALLADRIAAVRPGWAPGPADAATLRRIATALDGLPLALELVAARSRLLSLDDLAGHLHDALTFDARIGRGGVSPHATLAAAIDWSLALLAPDERDLLLRLWPFDGGLTVDAAEAVAGEGVLPRLATLVSRSVVAADTARTPTRFGLLETVRARCRQLDPDPGRSRRAQARWLRSVAAEVEIAMWGPGAAAATRRMAEELPNLRAALATDLAEEPVEALRTATRLDWWWYRRGAAVEGRRWLDAALAAAPDAPAALRARARTATGALHALGGDVAAALADFAEAERLLAGADPGDPDLAVTAVLVPHYRAMGALIAGDPAVAEATARENLPRARAAGLGPLEATAQLVAGAAAAAQGRAEEGRALLLEAVATAEAAGHVWAAGMAERLLAGFALAAGEPAQARALALRAAGRHLAEDDVSGVLGCLVVAAAALADLGRPGAAATVATAVLTRAARLDVRLDAMNLPTQRGVAERLAAGGSPADRARGERAAREAGPAGLVALAGE